MTDQNEIERIASVHLGRAGDGTVVKPYVTPDNIDPSLLVGIPRHLNRTQYDIKDDELPFVGVDTWNAYEFSCLMDNGFPISGTLRWSYSSDSANIIESKSAKLYLNSFNMSKMGCSFVSVRDNIQKQIQRDMSSVLGLKNPDDLYVKLFVNIDNTNMYEPIFNRAEYNSLDSVGFDQDIEFNHYNEDPNILEVVEDSSDKVFRYTSSLVRSNCRVTQQPDWADIFIEYNSKLTVTPESLIQYIVSLRKENHFHEEIVECVYKRLYDLLSPETLTVAALYTRRGGIDINPIRSSSKINLRSNPIAFAGLLTQKTMKQ